MESADQATVSAVSTQQPFDPRNMATVDDCINAIRHLSQSSTYYAVYFNWNVGTVLERAAELGEDDPASLVAQETGLKPRHLRYCRSVARAYTLEQVQQLTVKGMCWVTMRELSSELLESRRDELNAQFLEGTLTDQEVRQAAKEIKQRLLLEASGEEDPGGDEDPGNAAPLEEDTVDPEYAKAVKLLNQMTESLTEVTANTVKVTDAFREKVCKDLADVLLTPEGEVSDALVEAQQQLIAPLVELACTSLSVCQSMRVMAGQFDFVYEAVDTILSNARDLAEEGA